MAKKIFKNIEELVASIFLCITIGLVVLNIIMRYFLKTGISWSEEVATGAFVWTVYLGAVAAYKRGQHIGIDLIINFLKGRNRDLIKIIIDILLLILMIFITFLSCKYVLTTYKKLTPVLSVSSAYISAVIPISFFAMSLRTLQFIKVDMNAYFRDRQEARDE